MSYEKSQLENINLPREGGEAEKNKTETSSALPTGFSLGKQLTAEAKPASKSETLKYLLPNYLAGADRASQEEKEKKARLEREGVNYDLYLLIKGKLAGEFGENLLKSREATNDEETYNLLKEISLFDYINNGPELYTPTEKDLIYIVNNLRELLAEQKITKKDYRFSGIFLNSFIHAYFNSIPEEKRKDLKLNLPNTKDLDFIGSELSFGELEVEETGHYFGYMAHGSAILKAKEVWSEAGLEAHGNAQILAEEAGNDFGRRAHGSAILKATKKVANLAGQEAYGNAQILVEEADDYFGHKAHGLAVFTAKKVGNNAGWRVCDNVQMSVEETEDFFAQEAHGSAILTAKKAGNDVGSDAYGNAQISVEEAGDGLGHNAHGSAIFKAGKVANNAGWGAYDNVRIRVEEAGTNVGRFMQGNAKITIGKKYDSIGEGRRDGAQIILPNGQVFGKKKWYNLF